MDRLQAGKGPITSSGEAWCIHLTTLSGNPHTCNYNVTRKLLKAEFQIAPQDIDTYAENHHMAACSPPSGLRQRINALSKFLGLYEVKSSLAASTSASSKMLQYLPVTEPDFLHCVFSLPNQCCILLPPVVSRLYTDCRAHVDLDAGGAVYPRLSPA